MRNLEQIMNYVSKNKYHFLNVQYRGRWRQPQYTHSTIFGSDEYGEGTANCLQELYLTEEVVCAFTCYYSDWNNDNYKNAMVCLTNSSRVIIGLENENKTYEYNLDDYDLKRTKLKRYITQNNEYERIISVGMMNFMVKSHTTELADEYADKIIKILSDIVRKYAED